MSCKRNKQHNHITLEMFTRFDERLISRGLKLSLITTIGSQYRWLNVYKHSQSLRRGILIFFLKMNICHDI